MPRVRAFAPGGIGNLGPGLDIFGCAVAGEGDAVIAERASGAGVRIARSGHPDLPTDATRHASGIAAAEVLRVIGAGASGVVLEVEKGLPLASGQGGSAASAVAGAAAVNALFGGQLDPTQLLAAALAAESVVAGRHADNVAAALYGGIVLIRSLEPLEVVRLPVPAGIRIVLVHPHHRLSTADARRVLPHTIDRATAIHQAAQVAAVVTALHSGDLALLGRAIEDRIAEPARAPLLPGFLAAKAAAIEAGALACSISGAGPSAFALCADDGTGAQVGEAMRRAYAAAGVESDARVTGVDTVGVRLT